MDIPGVSPLPAAALNPAGGSAAATPVIDAGFATNLSGDAVSFAESLQRAGSVDPVRATSVVGEALLEPLDAINHEAKSLVEYAQSAIESGNELTPSEIVNLTARSHEFMFHAQLTANMANRTADGLQQLFRQQS